MDSDILIKDIPIEMFNGKTVLLTGATGIVGTHFLYAFHEMYKRGIDLHVIAIGQRFAPPHLSALFQEPFVKFYIMDLANSDIEPYFKDVDIIIHASTYAQPDKFMIKPELTIKLNTHVTMELIKKLRPDGKFLFLSSSEVYNSGTPPYVEEVMGTTAPDHPRSCYIESKRCGEAIVNAYRLKGIDAKSVRLSLAYGEGVRKDDQRALSMFIKQALNTGEIKLLHSANVIRTYCYVGDTVNMMLRVLLQGKQCVYNVGGTSSQSIGDMVRLIGKLTNVPVTITDDGDEVKGAPTNVRLDISRYIREFGERTFVPLEEGLLKTIEFQIKLINGFNTRPN